MAVTNGRSIQVFRVQIEQRYAASCCFKFLISKDPFLTTCRSGGAPLKKVERARHICHQPFLVLLSTVSMYFFHNSSRSAVHSHPFHRESFDPPYKHIFNKAVTLEFLRCRHLHIPCPQSCVVYVVWTFSRIHPTCVLPACDLVQTLPLVSHDN